jgi:uncharacterized damage-inducible protein DinB
MNLTTACVHILSQLTDFVEQIEERDFTRPSETLGNSTIGQHLRHTLEFFICFEQGCNNGVINYDKRLHDKLIESDKRVALHTLTHILNFVQLLDRERELKLEVGYDPNLEEFITIKTTLQRELVYNIEHAVHHMAIIKIGVGEIAPYVSLPHDFGIAVSTIRYKEAMSSPAH